MSKNSAIENAINYIKSSWRSGRTLKEIAEFHGVDSGNLERCFRNREGMTVKQFTDQQRKEYVRTALNDKLILGYEIGSDLGFTDDLAFYRWVKRAFGKSFAALRANGAAARIQGKVTRKSDKKE